MGLRTRILRHPALREFYRNYRVLLTFRGFLLAAAATTLYLLIANTLGLEQLQELEQVQDEPLSAFRVALLLSLAKVQKFRKPVALDTPD